MNIRRKKQIEKLIPILEDLQSDIEIIKDEEQEALDNTPDSLQGSERYEISEAAVDSMDSAWDSIQEAIDYLQEIIDG